MNLVGVCIGEEVVAEVEGRSQGESPELRLLEHGGHLSLGEGGGGGGGGGKRRRCGGEEGARGGRDRTRRICCNPPVVGGGGGGGGGRLRKEKGIKRHQEVYTNRHLRCCLQGVQKCPLPSCPPERQRGRGPH